VIRRLAMLCIALAMPAVAQTTLNGAGATFPYPMYSKWFSEYHNLHSDVQINYQSIGSGGGIRQVLAGTVDFGASDGPMTDEQLSQAKTKILHIPTVMGAVVPAYNIPGVTGEIKFTPDALAGIFLGKITSWNDKAITSANPGINFPNQSIIVVHRSDGSGTTFIFTDYLSKVSSEWQNGPGKGTSVKWPVGLGGKGNEGVAGQIRQLQGSIGYVELIYAVQNKIPYGIVRNASGAYIKASLESCRRLGPQNACGLSRIDHQCSGQRCIPYIELHLAADSSAVERSSEGEDSQRPAQLDHGQRPEDGVPAHVRAVAG